MRRAAVVGFGFLIGATGGLLLMVAVLGRFVTFFAD